MTETKITDEMVERAVKAFGWTPTQLASCRVFQTDAPHIGMRKALEAALNPPPEPEIKVTEGMLKAGDVAYFQATREAFDGGLRAILPAIYRAMESTRMKEQAAPYGAKDARQGGDRRKGRTGDALEWAMNGAVNRRRLIKFDRRKVSV